MWLAIFAVAAGYLGYRIATSERGLQVYDPKVAAEVLRNTTLYSTATPPGQLNAQLVPNVVAGALAFVQAPTMSGFDWIRNFGPGFTVLGPSTMWTETQPWTATTARLIVIPMNADGAISSFAKEGEAWVVILKDTGRLAKFSGMDGEHVAKTLHANDMIT